MVSQGPSDTMGIGTQHCGRTCGRDFQLWISMLARRNGVEMGPRTAKLRTGQRVSGSNLLRWFNAQ